MKILLLCGAQSNQVALASKIHERLGLSGVVCETRKRRKSSRRPLVGLIEAVLDRTIFLPIRKAWVDLLRHYRKRYPALPPVPSIQVSNINAPETIAFIEQIDPDLIMVSGTSIVKAEVLSMKPRKGIINLHTGLSPYVKGGPNCTNWCLAESMFDMIGNTVMWIDEGIDSGRILASELVPLEGSESLLELHIKVMEHAHDLYLRVVEYLSNCSQLPPGVVQRDIGTGKTYYGRDWTITAKTKLMRNIVTGGYKRGITNAQEHRTNTKVVSLPT
jgi:methionyl-tRNA formyltransferase